MNASSLLAGLIEAFQHPIDPEAAKIAFTPEQWRLLEGFLTPFPLRESQLIYPRGNEDKSLFLLESGRVTIHYENSEGKVRLCLVSPGNLFGEASFLGRLPRKSSAQVASAGKAWMLGRIKFSEMMQRNPELAVAVTQTAAEVLANRVFNGKRRVAIS